MNGPNRKPDQRYVYKGDRFGIYTVIEEIPKGQLEFRTTRQFVVECTNGSRHRKALSSLVNSTGQRCTNCRSSQPQPNSLKTYNPLSPEDRAVAYVMKENAQEKLRGLR